MIRRLLMTIVFFIVLVGTTGISVAVSINPNVALLGTASQSSTHFCQFEAYAGLAIDGNTSGDYFQGSMSHTNNDVDPFAWWEVDLIDDYIIDEIVIWNRIGAFDVRLVPFTLSILENNKDVAWSTSIYSLPGNPLVFSPPNVVGQFVRVQLDSQDYLQLAEVQVFAEPVPEPCTMLLLGTGLVGLGLYRKKKGKV